MKRLAEALVLVAIVAVPAYAGRVTVTPEPSTIILLATGIGVVAVSSLLAGFAHAYWQLLVMRGAVCTRGAPADGILQACGVTPLAAAPDAPVSGAAASATLDQVAKALAK